MAVMEDVQTPHIFLHCNQDLLVAQHLPVSCQIVTPLPSIIRYYIISKLDP